MRRAAALGEPQARHPIHARSIPDPHTRSLTLSPNVKKCFLKSLNVVYCSSQLIVDVVTVVNSVFCSKSGQKW